MFQQFNPPCGRASARRLSGYLGVFAVLLLTLVVPGAFAQVTHVSNPYAGATVYASPDYTTEVATAVATEPAGSALANQMTVVGKTPTFVWLDRIAAIAGGSVNSGRLGLQGHINAALAQQSGSTPIVVQLVIYDLPDRDCAALASNGELSIAGGDTPRGYTTPLTGTGIQEYENDYITPIYNILAAYKTNANIRFVLVIEDDSLPNIVTNTGYSYTLANCVAANGGDSYPTYSTSGVYVQGIQYALNQFHSLPNAYNYLDIGHHGWLGWTTGAGLAFPFYATVAKGTTAGFASVDGIITNTANYGPTKEPYMTATEAVGSGEVYEATFYSYDPSIDELSYAQEFYTGLTGQGFPSTLGFLIDTSRNGWGGPLRPTGASTSTDLNTFVNATKIDERDDMGQWCNQPNQGIGALPAVNPGGFANLQAYVWVKPPGESDGNYPGSTYGGVTSTTGDPNCDPAHDNALANGFATNAIPNSPSAGTFWLAEFVEDVQNAYPALPTSTSPGFTVNATATTVMQGTSVGSSVTVSAFNGFNSAVALTVSGLPAGVTASFSPTSVTGSGGSTLTFTATTTATVGAATVTVTGTSGSTVETSKVTLTVTARPEFTISVAPTTLSLPPNTNPTVTLTVTFVGGLTGSVSLSASGLPSGVQANFSPSSLNASGTVTVNFTSQASTPAGTYSVLLTGTDGSLVNSATLALTIPGTGFTLASSPATVAITQGKTATDTITVTDVGSFTGSVTLAASNLPSGVTGVWGTNPTTGSSVLTLTATSTATTGAFTVTITGTSGSTTATTTFTLNVSAATGFTLAPSSPTLSVTQGKTATDTITVTDVGGFTGSVTLVATNLPSGVTVAYGTNPTTSTSVLTFTASSTATAGLATVTITGTSGSTTATTTIALTVVSSTPSFTLAPSAPTLSVTQGKTATDTITVTDVNGFTGSVTLAATGLPSGVTVAYGTNPTTATSVLTFTASSTATAGLATVTITGTSGSTTAKTTIALTVSSSSGSACEVDYTISPQNSSQFGAAINIKNNGSTTLSGWSLTWSFANGQTIASSWNGTVSQSGANVTVSEQSGQTWENIPAGGSYSGFGFNGTWNGTTNAIPTAFSLNGTACTVN
ncbi:MAG: glycoside hydrolase family 6 protein [Terracidiphilus sp.]